MSDAQVHKKEDRLMPGNAELIARIKAAISLDAKDDDEAKGLLREALSALGPVPPSHPCPIDCAEPSHHNNAQTTTMREALREALIPYLFGFSTEHAERQMIGAIDAVLRLFADAPSQPVTDEMVERARGAFELWVGGFTNISISIGTTGSKTIGTQVVREMLEAALSHAAAECLCVHAIKDFAVHGQHDRRCRVVLDEHAEGPMYPEERVTNYEPIEPVRGGKNER